MYPKEETREERDERITREKKQASRRHRRNAVLGVLGVTAFPCVTLGGLGVAWNHMSSGLAGTSICAIIIASLGIAAATVIGLDPKEN